MLPVLFHLATCPFVQVRLDSVSPSPRIAVQSVPSQYCITEKSVLKICSPVTPAGLEQTAKALWLPPIIKMAANNPIAFILRIFCFSIVLILIIYP